MVINNLYYNLRIFKIKLTNWEYWSFNFIYFPVYFYWVWLSIKAKSFFFFNTSNPSIEYGGFAMESKKKIYDLLPKEIYPKTALLIANATLIDIENTIDKFQLQFPLVAKPDIGERGTAVKKLSCIKDVLDYKENCRVNFLLQEWCSYPNEIGLFFCKYPNEKQGFISGIVRKEFLTIKGDGQKSVEDLLKENDRFFLQLKTIKKHKVVNLDTILNEGEEIELVPYGNHCRGTKFIDESKQIDKDLTEVINKICDKIPDFYFGRFDIRFNNYENLKQGKQFSVIEINGAGSEPTHIYDPNHTIFFAWKEIIKHLKILYSISKQNKDKYNLQYLTFKEGLALLKYKKEYLKLINK